MNQCMNSSLPLFSSSQSSTGKGNGKGSDHLSEVNYTKGLSILAVLVAVIVVAVSAFYIFQASRGWLAQRLNAQHFSRLSSADSFHGSGINNSTHSVSSERADNNNQSLDTEKGDYMGSNKSRVNEGGRKMWLR